MTCDADWRAQRNPAHLLTLVNDGHSLQALVLAGHMAIMLLSEDNVSCEALILGQ